MTNDGRCCGGRCGGAEVVSFSRREFLEMLAVTTAGLALNSELAGAERGAARPPLSLPKAVPAEYPRTPPRVYRGEHLAAVGMPLGGIGTGSMWLDGRGQLAVWQIFNNQNEMRIPDSFFAVSVRSRDGQTTTRVLQTESARGLPPMAALEFEGGYPIARLTFQDTSLPVGIQLEAFNPMIPLDTLNSSVPCAVFRLTAHNPGETAADVFFAASLQNAVGSQGPEGIQNVKSSGYGGNHNHIVRDASFTAVTMDKTSDPVQPGPVKIRAADGREVAGPDLIWLDGRRGLDKEVAEALARVANQGGAAFVDGASANFFEAIRVFRAEKADLSQVGRVFEDFERDNYEGWSTSGEAFGKKPSRGTEANQQPVSGFAGGGLVNTFIAGDGPKGNATSRPFLIEHRYIGFLIGGGSHAGQTCVNLRVGDKVVRTATGKDREELHPTSWDVEEFRGQQAVLEIVDQSSDAWGHINADQIVFAAIPPEPFLQKHNPAAIVSQAIGFSFGSAEDVTVAAGETWTLSLPESSKEDPDKPWPVPRFTRLMDFSIGESEYRVLLATPQGEPLLVEGPLGKGRIVLALAPELPWSWGSVLLAAARGKPLSEGERLVPGASDWGTMTLAAVAENVASLPGWTKDEEIAGFLADPAKRSGEEQATSPQRETINGALGVPLTLKPGERRTVTFVLAWHFPNAQRFQHAGNLYNRRWSDATAVARHVVQNLDALWLRTRQYHETLYQSNLPEEFLDAMTSQSVIIRGPTCFWSEDGYFGGFEGCYGCCPLNCTHVWNYAQTHARLFPEIGRNMRISNFITFLHPDGETSHREHGPHNAFIDGHCACIEAAYREHQLSADRRFLERIWPGVQRSVDWLIQAVDSDHDGVPSGHQWNTYDTAVSGANTFIGSQYLSALAAGERMAELMGDAEASQRWRTVREAGMKNQNEQLWNGAYYIQLPGSEAARDYNTGCHADQLLGQWWAHMLGLGYLYPPDRVKAALQSIVKHNLRTNFTGFAQSPRRYVLDEEGGLLMCTWPQGGRPQPFILYADEVWTGIEYATAGALIYEGLIDEARTIVRTARSRYDGRLREDLNSGPGGNPFNELECGKFYARALSSWSLLIACQGLLLDGPNGILGFRPKWQPEDHRAFFTTSGAWGLFVQQRSARRQSERIEVRYGQLTLRELVFELPDTEPAAATLHLGDRPLAATLHRDGPDVRLLLDQQLDLREGDVLEVTFM